MHISRFVLHNWMVYRGTTELKLQPKSYAIVARMVTDAERSNWMGKSALLEPIDFVLTGRLNPDRKMGADGWVSDGEREGSVLLEFDDGTIAERKRKGSTQLYVTLRGGKTATKDEAQAILDEMVGLTADDFVVTSYFRQRKLSQFILCDPSERMAYVRAWFRLAPLEQAEELIRVSTAELSTQAGVIAQQIERVKDAERQALGDLGGLAALEVVMREVESQLAIEKDRLVRLQGVLADNARLVVAKNVVEHHLALINVSREFQAQLMLVDEKDLEKRAKDVQATFQDASIKKAEAQAGLHTKIRLSKGQFDGRCPIAEMQCPVRERINSQQERNNQLAREAQSAHEAMSAEYDRWEAAAGKIGQEFDQYRELRRKLDQTLEEIKAGEGKYAIAMGLPAPADVSDLQARIASVQDKVTFLSTQIDAYRRAFRTVSEGVAEMGRLALQADLIDKQLSTHREALVIFGKNGAQRRVAESALRVIQASANEMLSECGIDLDVEVMWTREGSGLAKTCDVCGHPFPTSRKVKECERCHTERGPLLVNKLEIAMSEQSGAAEDLAGAAIQLAASAWLRRKRGSRWSVALIDEPFGQLDAVHRRTVAAHLGGMLQSRYGFDQSFIISHSNHTADMLPGRIEVVNDGTKSTARVIS